VPKFGLFSTAILIGLLNSIAPGFLIFTIGWKKTGVLFVIGVATIIVFGLQNTFKSNNQNLVYSHTRVVKSYQVLDSFTIEGKDTSEVNRELIINGTSQCVFPILQKEPNAPLPFSVENEILNLPDVNDKLLLLLHSILLNYVFVRVRVKVCIRVCNEVSVFDLFSLLRLLLLITNNKCVNNGRFYVCDK
jgi:hypothetical protein